MKITALLVGVIVCAGCSKSAAVAPPQVGRGAGAAVAAPAEGIRAATVRVDGAIAKACGIEELTEPHHFDTDDASLARADRSLLGSLAECLTKGALRDSRVSLVGHADPRGEHSYNFALGEQRASAVRRHLELLGVASDRITTTSRGELDALGQDEQSWAHDRRVDVAVVD